MHAQGRTQPLVATLALVCAGPAWGHGLAPAWMLLGIFSDRWCRCFSRSLNETEMRVEPDGLGKGPCGLLCSREPPPHGGPRAALRKAICHGAWALLLLWNLLGTPVPPLSLVGEGGKGMGRALVNADLRASGLKSTDLRGKQVLGKPGAGQGPKAPFPLIPLPRIPANPHL